MNSGFEVGVSVLLLVDIGDPVNDGVGEGEIGSAHKVGKSLDGMAFHTVSTSASSVQ